MRKEKSKPEIINPCRDCLLLAICLSQYQNLGNLHSNHGAASTVSHRCELLYSYFRNHLDRKTINIPNPFNSKQRFFMTKQKRIIINGIIERQNQTSSSSSFGTGFASTSGKGWR